MTVRLLKLVLLVLLISAALGSAALARETLDLNGEWQALVSDATTPPASDNPSWTPLALPSLTPSLPGGPHAIWYRTRFVLPLGWFGELAGDRVVVCLTGAKFAQQVFFNGAEVGRHVGGFEPTEYDVTSRAAAGWNELLIRVQDWTALLAPAGKAATPGANGVKPPESAGPRPLLAPVGASREEMGIWGRVWIEHRPRVFLSQVVVTASIRTGMLQVTATVKNTGAAAEPATLSARVAEDSALLLAPETVTVAPGGEQTVTLSAPWPSVEPWWPQRPRLYTLLLGLRSGWLSEGQQVTFGFREVRTEGRTLLLNEVPVQLFVVSSPPLSPQTDPTALFRALQNLGVNTIELADQPWPEPWYDAADAAGLMVIADSALTGPASAYQLDSPQLWEAAKGQMLAMVSALGRHPSIVAWNLADLAPDAGAASKQLAALSEAVHARDHTRPVLCTGGGEAEGKADLLSVSAAHAPTQGQPSADTAPWSSAQWSRGKPLAVTDLVRLSSDDMTTASIFFGDAAVTNADRYRSLAEATLRHQQIMSARQAGVSAIWGGTVTEALAPTAATGEALASGFHPVVAFDESESAQCFAGTALERRVAVLNNSLMTRQLELRWRLAPRRGKWEVNGSAAVTVAPGLVSRVGAALALPVLAEPITRADFTLELWEGPRCIFTSTVPWRVFARTPFAGPIAKGPKHVVLYDPTGRTAPALAEAGIGTATLDPEHPQAALRHASVAIIGEGAVDGRPAADDPAAQALREFVRDGGTLLVLAQPVYPTSLPVSVVAQRAAIAFVRDLTHPALQGLSDQDFAYWMPDDLVSHLQFAKSAWGGFRTLLDSGGADGVATAGLGEVRLGKGRAILCEVELVDRYGIDPGATWLLRNLLAYTATKPAPTHRVGLIGDEAAMAQVGASGAEVRSVPEGGKRLDLRGYQALLVQDIGRLRGHEAEVRSFVRRGGRVLLHNVNPANVEVATALLGGPVTLTENEQSVFLLGEATGAGAGLSNEDLCWLEPSAAGPTPSPRVASYLVDLMPAPHAVGHAGPGLLLSLPDGKGEWVIDQVRWDDCGNQQVKANRYLATLLQNLGVTFDLPTR